MNTKDKNEGSTLTILEAVESLSRIAEMDLDRELTFAEESEVNLEETPALNRSVQWLQPGDMNATLDHVRETFKVILNYLRKCYTYESEYSAPAETTEGIKTIMVLVGEAAKKLDKYSTLFHHKKMPSITELKEYRHLQEFYLSRIAHKVDDNLLGKWLMSLTKRMLVSDAQTKFEAKAEPAQSSLSKHVFVDLDSVKKDAEYELFFIRKEDGSRFFSPRLIRNIKLLCDFGETLNVAKKDDPIESLPVWKDHSMCYAARQILRAMAPMVDNFYHHPQEFLVGELGVSLSKAMIALMLCSDRHNIVHDTAVKCSVGYFRDFLFYLREALRSRDYQKLIAYPPKKGDTHAWELLRMTQDLCKALFTEIPEDPEVTDNISHLISEAHQEVSSEHAKAAADSKCLWNTLGSDYVALTKLMKRHQNGPLMKVLDLLEDGSYNAFDSLWQNNLPHQLFWLQHDGHRVMQLHVPAPTYQEFINKVVINEEFKSFLRAMAMEQGEHYLYFNLQDRTSWRERSRSMAIEELQHVADFADVLTVVTLPKDTEFYQQIAPYNVENHAEAFFKHFRKNLEDTSCGFYFPEKVREAIFPEFVDELMHGVHRVFFSSKNVLTRDQRLDFIEIFYLFLELKIVEIVKPTKMSLSCKDGIDVGAAASAELFAFLRLLNDEAMDDRTVAQLNSILYGPAIAVRERVILSDRFSRFQNTLKAIQSVKQEFGSSHFVKIIHEAFGLLYKTFSFS